MRTEDPTWTGEYFGSFGVLWFDFFRRFPVRSLILW
jgi:hypothetical protein